jgi:hypothetical protein
MNVRVFIDRDKYAVEVRHNNKKVIRYTDISENFNGGEYSVVEESADKLIYKISPLYETMKTENGYMRNYNIKLTNWLNFFIYKSVKSVLNDTEFSIKKQPSDFSRELIEHTEIVLTKELLHE